MIREFFQPKKESAQEGALSPGMLEFLKKANEKNNQEGGLVSRESYGEGSQKEQEMLARFPDGPGKVIIAINQELVEQGIADNPDRFLS